MFTNNYTPLSSESLINNTVHQTLLGVHPSLSLLEAHPKVENQFHRPRLWIMTPRGRLKKAKRCCASVFVSNIYTPHTHTHTQNPILVPKRCILKLKKMHGWNFDLLILLWEMKGKIQDIKIIWDAHGSLSAAGLWASSPSKSFIHN